MIEIAVDFHLWMFATDFHLWMFVEADIKHYEGG